MRAAVETVAGVAVVDLEDEEIVEIEDDSTLEDRGVTVELPLVVAADESGSFIVAVVARRPPLVVSHDAGATWREAGHGLPPGRDVAISPEHPDTILFAGESRLYLSRDGGRFWNPLGVELAGIRRITWLGEEYLG